MLERLLAANLRRALKVRSLSTTLTKSCRRYLNTERVTSLSLGSSSRFKISSTYNKKWKYVIYAQRQEDNDGFVQMYVPKDAILTEEVVASQKGRPRKASKVTNNKVGYIYQKKQQKEDEKQATNQKQFHSKMQSLLSGLKP